MSGHAAGPWRISWLTDEDGDRYFDVLAEDIDADDDGRPVDASYSIIEMAYPVDGDEAISRANARLIAAAPDLLAALKAIIEVAADIAAEQCDGGENVSYWNRPSGGGWRAITQARAAILKATGEQP